MNKGKEQSFAHGPLSKGAALIFGKTDMMLVVAASSTSPNICLFSLKRRDREGKKKKNQLLQLESQRQGCWLGVDLIL